MAGSGGFEPPNAGTKTLCLAAWRRPKNNSKLKIKNGGEAGIRTLGEATNSTHA